MRTTVVLLIAGVSAWGQTMTPRQLWNDEPAPAKAVAAANPAPKHARRAKPKPGPAEPVQAASASARVEPSNRQSTVSVMPVSSPVPAPLAFRYSLFEIVNGSRTEVGPDTKFHSGEEVQIAVEANRDAYIYVVAQGSSGKWKPMLPSEETTADNRIPGRRSYMLPSEKKTFRFNNQAGEERLFMILSSDPIADLDGLIYSLRDGGTKRDNSSLLAKNIDNSVIAKLRGMHSRDLTIEKIDDEPEAQKEAAQGKHAIYVANMRGGRVVGDLVLIHE